MFTEKPDFKGVEVHKKNQYKGGGVLPKKGGLGSL